jgi:hypothetical protein
MAMTTRRPSPSPLYRSSGFPQFRLTVSGAAGLAYVEMWVDWDGTAPGSTRRVLRGLVPERPESIAMTVPLNAVARPDLRTLPHQLAGVGTPYGRLRSAKSRITA